MERKFSWLASILFWLLLSGADGFIGIQWGRFATQSLVPSMVVDLLMQNGINEIRLSAPSPNVMEALQSSGLGVTVALQNDFIKRMKWTSNLKNISTWMEELLLTPVQRGVHIKYVSSAICILSLSYIMVLKVNSTPRASHILPNRAMKGLKLR